MFYFFPFSEDIKEGDAYDKEPEIGDLMEWIAPEVCFMLKVYYQ